MMINEWINFPTGITCLTDADGANGTSTTKPRNRKPKTLTYFQQIKCAVYVMLSKHPGAYHIGIIGRDKIKNTAAERLKQVGGSHKRASRHHLVPFDYIFLAPLPHDLGHKLMELEELLQKGLSNKFGGKASDPIWRPNTGTQKKAIQKLATSIVLCFLRNRYAGSASALKAALQPFNHKPPPSFVQNPKRYKSVEEFLCAEKLRAKVFEEAIKVFDVGLAKALVACLMSGNINPSGLSPCNMSAVLSDAPSKP